MNLKDVQRVLKAKILVGEELMERPVETCCGLLRQRPYE